MERGGFDAIIGNPPFLGGQKLTGAMGTNIRDWFVNVLANGRKGSADLVAYFFLRAMSLLNSQGNLGLIATNTVAQGDTREVGLKQMVDERIHDHARHPEPSGQSPAPTWSMRRSGAPAARSRLCSASGRRYPGRAHISTLLEPRRR